MIGNVNQPSTHLILDVDGTLTAGAVDVAAVLADNVVQAAKLADGAVPSPNLAYDPFNRYPTNAPSTANIDGRRRWQQGTGTRVADAASPVSGYSIRCATTTVEGKRLWLSEMGLKEGDIISVALLAKVGTGRSVSVALAFRNAAGVAVGSPPSYAGSTVVGDDGTHFIAIDAKTIPTGVGCVAIDVYLYQISGTGTVDIYGWFVVRGSKVFENDGAEGVAAGQRAWDWLHNGVFMTSPVNLAFDPFNRYYAPTAADQDGARGRWYNSAGTLAYVNPDTGNPFGLPTVRATGNGGKRFYLDEMGLRVGDVITIGFLAYIPTGTSFAVGRTWRTSAYGNAGAAASATYTGANTVQLCTYASQTIVATTHSVECYLSGYAGGGNVDIYAWFVVRGNGVDLRVMEEGTSPGQRAQAWIQHNGGQHRIAFGREMLGNLAAKLGRIEGGDTCNADIVVLGDSWIQYDPRLAQILRDKLQLEYGDAGPGWFGTSTADGGYFPQGQDFTYADAGTWTHRNHISTPAGRGVDLCESFTNDAATPASITVGGATYTVVEIHYLKHDGGGTFQYNIDSTGWSADIDTQNATDDYGVETISGLSDAAHSIQIKCTGASTAGLVIFGFNFREAGPGVRVHKAGSSGSASSHWAAPDATLWKAALTSLTPDAVVIVLGTNDDATDVAPATYKANTKALIGRIRAITADSGLAPDIMLFAPADNAVAGTTYGSGDYVPELQALAREEGCALMNAYQLLGSYANQAARAIRDNPVGSGTPDTAHINPYAGQIIIGSMIRELIRLD